MLNPCMAQVKFGNELGSFAAGSRLSLMTNGAPLLATCQTNQHTVLPPWTNHVYLTRAPYDGTSIFIIGITSQNIIELYTVLR
jgi:hypothetical protein